MLTKKSSTPYIFLAPLIIASALLLIYPLYKVIELSFFSASFLNPGLKTFTGIDNYKWLFSFKFYDPKYSYFVSAFFKSLIWVFCSLIIKVIIGVVGATILNSKYLYGKKIYRSLIIIPWAIPWAMAAMMWSWTLNSQFGILNSILTNLHLISRPVTFLANPTGAFITTFVIDAWMGLPFMLVMILSGLQSIPESYYEAAKIDGASDIKSFFKITLPLLKPVLLTVSLLSLVWTFNSFDIIWILTKGGPINSTETLPVAIYNVSFLLQRFGGLGKASAMTIIQVLFVTIISIFYIKTLEKGD